MNNSIRIGLISLLVLSTGLVAMPQSWKEKVPVPSAREFLLSRDLSYGLDLAGGSQLDFKVDMSRVEEKIAAGEDITKEKILEGVKATLERRIDPDGTKELNVFTSDFNGEKHVFVELTADIDTPEIREKLSKHIDLQFMRQKERENPDDLKPAQEAADEALALIQSGTDFAAAAEAVNAEKSPEYAATANLGQTSYKDELPEAAQTKLWNASAGTIVSEALKTDNGYAFDGQNFRPIQGYSVYRAGEKATADRVTKTPGEDFLTVATELSTDSVTEKIVDDLPDVLKKKVLVSVGPNEVSEAMEYEGKQYVFKMIGLTGENSVASVQQIVLASAADAEAARERVAVKETTTQEQQLTYDEIFVMGTPNPWEETGLDGQNFSIAKVSQDNLGMPVTSIDFDDEGAIKFEALTEELVGQPMAIFVGGEFISAPTIQEKISGGSAQISFGGSYAEAQQEAYLLARDLNAGAIPAPIALDGELKVAASLGADALSNSLKAGLIGLALLSLWLMFAYRLLGVFAVISLAIYATLLFFILKLTPLFVLTLAGIAGIILSIGMAVDANVLIFERMREELRSGKNFSASLAIGFERAWTSIRDANITTLIVCGILFALGTSIVKGFATMLAVGVLLSMFTAVTITRTLLKLLVGTGLSRKKDVITKL